MRPLDNMGMLLRTIIPTVPVTKSYSVIPHQEWGQIQVPFRDEKQEMDINYAKHKLNYFYNLG